MAEILFGHSYEGKLTMTFERSREDNLTSNSYYPDKSLQHLPSVRYREGVFIGYWYSTLKAMLFPFGYGLSFTTFQQSHLKENSQESASDPLTGAFDVTNTGDCEGTEGPQVYVGAYSLVVPRPVGS